MILENKLNISDQIRTSQSGRKNKQTKSQTAV